MSIIAEYLQQVSLMSPVRHKNLTMFPLHVATKFDADYITLDDALKQGCAKVAEVSESGSVPELKFVNECENRILLLDGEELIGAKQNRVLNLSILVPARSTIVIPVSCVEAGRWHHESREFRSSGRAHYASGRSLKSRSVTSSLSSMGSSRSDQQEVWRDIDEKSARMSSFSGTHASSAMYEDYQEHINGFVAALQAVPEQCGALFLINGVAIGFDVFENNAIFNKLLPKLVHSYALDAIDQATSQETPNADAEQNAAQQLLDQTKTAKVETFKAVGEGQDLRLVGEKQFSGGALEVDNRILHLFGFNGIDANDESPQSRILRSSMRRNSRR